MAISVFSGLPADLITSMLQPLERRTYSTGAELVHQGQVLSAMLVVNAGTAGVYLGTGTSHDHIVNTIGVGGTIGEMAMFTGEPASATIRALGNVDVTLISQPVFREMADAHPVIYQNLAAILAERLAHTNRHIATNATEHATLLRGPREHAKLATAIAASVAWHVRTSTVLVLVDIPAGTGPAAGRVGPWLEVVRTTADLAGGVLEAQSHRQSRVLAFAEQWSAARAERTIVLQGPHDRANRSELRVAAWVEGSSAIRPDSGGVLAVPPLSPGEEQAIAHGYLTNRSPAGRAIGWLARDIARCKVGLALGAGSVKGYAHFGVLKILEHIGLVPDAIAGTSIGAIIASMVALGIGAERALEIMEATSSRAFRLTLPTRSLLSDSGVRSNFQMIGGDTRFEDVSIPFAAVATDLDTGSEVILRRGLLRTAVLASMAIPGIYPAIRIGGRTLVDGGIANPVPISVVSSLGADQVIAVPLREQAALPPVELEAIESGGKGPGVLPAVLRAVEIMQSRIAISVLAGTSVPTVFVEPRVADVSSAGLRSFNQGRPYVATGERAAEEAIPELRSRFPWLQPMPEPWVTEVAGRGTGTAMAAPIDMPSS